MADEADIASSFIDNEVSRALEKLRQTSIKHAGTKTCSECGETIPLARRNLGFSLCVTCAEETERRKSLFASY